MMGCGFCDFWDQVSDCSGICTCPDGRNCGEYVGLSDSCGKWVKKREVAPANETILLCSRCFHNEICSSVLKGSLWADAFMYGKEPKCKYFREIVPCGECKHYEESIAYCELNSYFVDSDGLCCSPADSPNWEMWEKTEFCSRGERRTKDGKQRETG